MTQRLLLSLALGVVLTLIVAWVCAAWSPSSVTAWGIRDDTDPWCAFALEEGIGVERLLLTASAAAWPGGRPWSEMERRGFETWVPRLESEAGLRGERDVLASGWPWPCLFSTRVTTTTTQQPTWEHAVVLQRTAPRDDLALPYGPIWTGVLLDVATWMVSMLALITVTRFARRAVRRLRGRCTACGYDLARSGVDRCPECGAE